MTARASNRSIAGLILASAAIGACGASATESGGGSSPATVPDLTVGGGNLIRNATFADGTSLPWTVSFSAPAEGKSAVEDGALCLHVDNKGVNAWDAQVRHRDLTIKRGHKYTIHFKAYASEPTKARPKIGMIGTPYTEYWASVIELTDKPQVFAGQFTMNGADDPTSELTFHVGGNVARPSGPFRVCIADVHLDDPEFVPPRVQAGPPPPKVRVNQVGYFPSLVKRAIVANPSPSPLHWELLGANSAVVAQGDTVFSGPDAASGDTVHIADLSAVKQPGEGYKVRVGKDTSPPFAIGRDIYKKLKYDALAYFYQNRSGIPITMPYAGDAKWTRPAGHESDKSVPCAPGSGCTYSLDVSGGWYDAGDHGKYVVNGGISVWTLLDQYERAKHLGTSVGDFGDGKMSIPEGKNGVPDLLDEARWELELLLRMQVPEGNPLTGMVHHKVHDEKWTALATAPQEDTMKRFLYPPSTAATLNLAAVAAQAARIWKTIDPAFSSKCLAAAERAWAAAQAHPDVYAPPGGVGGGPYDDKDVSDELYWAAAELFITTGKAPYRTFLLQSPHFKVIPSPASGALSAMTWQSTQTLGTISLAVVPNGLDAPSIAALRASIVAAANGYLDIMETQGYRIPLKLGPGARAPWGSNSFVINNLVILALANDFAAKPQYLSGVIEGMDYLLGRNPLAQSYVTGYGDRPLLNPHHRFWAHQANDKYPPAPPGAVSGGPNSDLQDPYVQAAGLKGCPPLRCFADNIEAWSVNEIAINWNAPFAWVVAYLDEKGK